MKANKLIVEFDYDFEVLGITSHLKDYKLALQINQCLNIELVRTDDVCLEFVKEGKIVVSHFIFETEYSCIRLLKNKSLEHDNVSKPFLIPDLKEYDYFIHLYDEGNMWNINEVTEELKTLNNIQYVHKIDLNNLKSRENLIF